METDKETQVLLDLAALSTELRNVAQDVHSLRTDLRAINRILIGDSGTNGLASRMRQIEREAATVKRLLWTAILAIVGTASTALTVSVMQRMDQSQQEASR